MNREPAVLRLIPGDVHAGRHQLVQLTAKGRQRERHAFEPVLRKTLALLAIYTSAERGVIADFLRRIAAITERQSRWAVSRSQEV